MANKYLLYKDTWNYRYPKIILTIATKMLTVPQRISMKEHSKNISILIYMDISICVSPIYFIRCVSVFEPPSSPDIEQLSDTSLQLKWTSGSLRDKGVKGYKIEYLKGNETKVFGGLHSWHVVANRIKPKFRIFKVNNLEPERMYR